MLHERGHLTRAAKVAAIESMVNIGEGRGFANYSWKIVARYDIPVSVSAGGGGGGGGVSGSDWRARCAGALVQAAGHAAPAHTQKCPSLC